ncbi:MAG: bifunctional adenosylcobinamide kinase/adenosylcobinamide-phosphate guanylyltransferase [Rhodospirillales bacterium]
MTDVTLVLGGARSGKSAYAEQIVEELGGGLYIATAEASDDEMRDRITLHQARRGEHWDTVETPVDLVDALLAADLAHRPVLVDCLTIWLSNLMHHEIEHEAAFVALTEMLGEIAVPVVIVSNELGLGVVPENALARRFRDAHGVMNQMVAAAASRVVFVAAGLPQILKDAAK